MSPPVESLGEQPASGEDHVNFSPNSVMTIEQMLHDREFDWDKPIPETKTAYRIGKVPICTRGNITAITGQPKTGKSSFLAALAASTMTAGKPADTLHVTAANTEGHAIVHIDTEQDRQRHDTLVRNIARRAGLGRLPRWFHSYSAKGLPPDTLRGILVKAISQTAASHGGINSVLLDGIADFVSDPNKAEECLQFITWLEGLAVQYDTVVIGVLHLNPVSQVGSGTKSRGHLGSQLERKVETEIRLRRDGDGATAFWTSFARGQPIVQADALRFKWSDTDGYHVAAETKKAEKEFNQLRAKYLEARALFGSESSVTYKELIHRIALNREITPKGAEQRFTNFRNAGVLIEDGRRWKLLPLNREDEGAPTVSLSQSDNLKNEPSHPETTV